MIDAPVVGVIPPDIHGNPMLRTQYPMRIYPVSKPLAEGKEQMRPDAVEIPA